MRAYFKLMTHRVDSQLYIRNTKRPRTNVLVIGDYDYDYSRLKTNNSIGTIYNKFYRHFVAKAL